MKFNRGLKKNIRILKELYENPKSLEWNKNFIFKNRFQPSFILIRGISDFHNSQIYRARSVGNDEDLTDIKTFKYPPIEFNSVGRTNLKSKQTLYSSNCPTTSILEYLNTGKSNETVFLSIWKFKKESGIQSFYINEFNDDLEYLKWKLHKNANKETLRMVKEIFSYLIRLFKSKNFNFSAPLSHFLLYTHKICDMIKYPSVVTNSQSYNYSINTVFFDKNFELHRVYKLDVKGKINMGELEGNNDLKVIMKPVEIGEVRDNKITYKTFEEEKDNFWNDYIELKL